MDFSDTLFEKCGFDVQKFTSTAEISKRLAEISAVLADFAPKPSRFFSMHKEIPTSLAGHWLGLWGCRMKCV